MATVYLAYDVRHDRRVALKVLHRDLASTLEVDRFLQEIRTAARLQHPHILPVFDSGETSGRTWYVMPYVEGGSVRQRMDRDGPLGVSAVLEIARSVAEALDHAHRQGIVHRDIKPENILLADGHAVVADFGIARAVDASATARLTAAGLAIGTPAYLSPEQAGGADVIDGRSDLYSLGCVVYEMLSGEALFRGNTPQAIIVQRFRPDPGRLRKLRKVAPSSVILALEQALALTPEERFATAGQFADALAARPTTASAAFALLDRRRRRPVLLATVLGALLVAGFALWPRGASLRRSSVPNSPPAAPAAPARAPTVAVLPFGNSGEPREQLFADGVADEVRARLAALGGLRVIASASASRYRNSDKSPEEIGRELGAQYLLFGKVRWDERDAGASRVRVSPELVQVAGAPAATTLWQQTFDTPATDLSTLPESIAVVVAEALRLELGAAERDAMGTAPRRDPEAYEAYLRGREIIRQGASGPADLGRALAHFQRAVALDSSFASAWAQLGWTKAVLWTNVPGQRPELLDEAKAAGDRALKLGGAEAEARQVLAFYQLRKGNRGAAMEETALGLRADPSNARLVGYMAAFLELDGRWADALEYRKKALALDPTAAGHAAGLATNLLWLRRYPEARAAADRYVILGPSNPEAYQLKAMVALAQGNLAEARAAIRAGEGPVPRDELLAFVAYYWDVLWLLDDEQQRRVLELGPSAFYGDTVATFLVKAGTHLFRGDSAKARPFAERARAAAMAAVRREPMESSHFAMLGLANAYLGNAEEAIKAVQTSVALVPLAKDAMIGAFMLYKLASIESRVGRHDEALATLETLLGIPFYVSPAWLRIDPNFAPMRGDPRFARLTGGAR